MFFRRDGRFLFSFFPDFFWVVTLLLLVRFLTLVLLFGRVFGLAARRTASTLAMTAVETIVVSVLVTSSLFLAAAFGVGASFSILVAPVTPFAVVGSGATTLAAATIE